MSFARPSPDFLRSQQDAAAPCRRAGAAASMGPSPALPSALGHLLDNVPLPVWFKGADRRYEFSNAAWAGLHGLTPTDLIGRTDEELHTGCSGAVSRLLDEEALRLSSAVTAVESVLVEGREPISLRVTRLRVLDGPDVAGLAGYAEPVSSMADDSGAAHRAIIRQFALLAHEFRSPLGGIMGLTGCLVRAGNLDDLQLQRLLTLQGCCDHLIDLANEMLDFDRALAGQLRVSPVPTDLAQIMREVANCIRPWVTRPDVVIKGSLDPSLPRAAVIDPLRMRQVLLNLLANAVRHTELGFVAFRLLSVSRIGPRSAAAREGSDGPAGPHQLPQKATRLLRVEVEDSGHGIDEADQAHLFQLFKPRGGSSPTSGTGAGLGLPLSNQIVLAMGGELQVRSKPGLGTLISFEIPIED